MTIIRRLYAYVLAFAGLALFAVAAANLAQLLTDVVLHASGSASDAYVRNTASLHGAAALVGLPVWWLHWRWIQRTVRTNSFERTSVLRALFMYVILAGAAIVMAVSTNEALANLFAALTGLSIGAAVVDADAILRPLPFAIVGALVWLAHWRIAEVDRAADVEVARVATLRRLYVYGAALVSWLVLLANVQAVLQNLWQTTLPSDAGAGALTVGASGLTSSANALSAGASALATPAAAALVALAVWLSHWAVLPARLPSADVPTPHSPLSERTVNLAPPTVSTPHSPLSERIGHLAPPAVPTPHSPLSERTVNVDSSAVTRSVYLFAALAVGVIGTLGGASQLLFYVVGRVLGVDRPGGVGGGLLTAAAGPASAMLVYGVGWAYHRAAIRHHDRLERSTPRQVGVERLYRYLVALVALVVWATGLGGLLWVLGEALLGLSPADPSSVRESLALFATLSLVGLPVWLSHWRPALPQTDASHATAERRIANAAGAAGEADAAGLAGAAREAGAAGASSASRAAGAAGVTGAARAATAGESQSLARRLYVYLSLLGATLVLVASTAAALYRLLGLLLGEPYSAQLVTDLAHAVALAMVSSLLAAYHWHILRRDTTASRLSATTTPADNATAMSVSATTAPADNAAPATGVSVTTSPPAPVLVEIQAHDPASLARALQTLDALRASGLDVTVLGRTASG